MGLIFENPAGQCLALLGLTARRRRQARCRRRSERRLRTGDNFAADTTRRLEL